jgi:hypothetical protein
MAKKTNLPNEKPGSGDNPESRRQLVVIVKKELGLKASAAGLTSSRDTDVSSLTSLLEAEGVQLTPLFGDQSENLSRSADTPDEVTGLNLPDLSVYFQVDGPDESLDQIAEKLLENEFVEAAYVKPPASPAIFHQETEAAPVVAPPATPNFTARQGYLDAAPGGIDARYAWTQAGGRGFNVRVIDIEGGWNFGHEDLATNNGGLVGGTNSTDMGWVNHGTAVVGVIGGDLNSIGVTGIASDANVSGISIFGLGEAAAIQRAADRLAPGDIILIELHAPGPRFNFTAPSGQRGFVAMEYWPDIFDAIRYAVAKGVIVIEAAGNGAENFDDPIYNTRPAGFPASWSNPFRRGARDSGAILVGAGAPPPGTHGRNHGPDRSRLDFSNYGSAVDVQGWGQEVTTTGYGDLQGGPQNQRYTDTFNGTSSASPIVVGAVSCVQGYLRGRGRIPLTPARARDLLRSTGSPQQDAPGRPATQRIGNRPNLRQMIANVSGNNTWTGVQFRGNLGANQTRRWFTFNWPAHWHVYWTVVPTTVRPGAPEVKHKVMVERSNDAYVTYWIEITNLTGAPVDIEARFAVLGW